MYIPVAAYRREGGGAEGRRACLICGCVCRPPTGSSGPSQPPSSGFLLRTLLVLSLDEGLADDGAVATGA